MSETWERGEHPSQAEVHEPIIEESPGGPLPHEPQPIEEGQVWRQGGELLEEKWLVVLSDGTADGDIVYHEVVIIAPGNRVADTVERSVPTDTEIRAEWTLFTP
jgi:hypothetical protein